MYRLMSEAKLLNHEGKIRATMSASFTTELSRARAKKGVKFEALIGTVKQELDGKEEETLPRIAQNNLRLRYWGRNLPDGRSN